jgi:hypothetical protein
MSYGAPVVVVSGLPRSGTSMTMKMLEAGGLTALTDGIRTADSSNPNGYYELEAVKGLDKNGDTAWLREARGKAIKIISFLLTYLPDTHHYQVVFMQRDLEEVVASQNKMLVERGETPHGQAPGPPADPSESGEPGQKDERMIALYRQHLDQVMRFLANRRRFSLLEVNYADALARPAVEARRISDFLGGKLDVDRMAAVADPALYRNRGRDSRSV